MDEVKNQKPERRDALLWRIHGTHIVVGIILLLAVAIRIAFLFDLAKHPFMLAPHGWMPDNSAFDNSALAVAERGRTILGLPAIERKHPRAIYMGFQFDAPEIDGSIRGKEYINHPDEPPARPLLYVYFLGLLYFVLGDNQIGIRLAQMALGLCCALLVYSLARRICGRAAALFALAIGALYWPLIVYENIHHDKTLVAFCLLLMGHAALRWAERRTLPNAAVLGAMLGMSLYGAPALILFVPVMPLWMAWVAYRRDHAGPIPTARILRHMAIMGLAFSLAYAPLVMRNYRACGRIAPIAGAGTVAWHIVSAIASGEDINEHRFVEGPYWDDNAEQMEAIARYDTNWSGVEMDAALGWKTLSHLLSNPIVVLRHCITNALRFWAPKENHGLTTHYVIEYAFRLLSAPLSKLPGNFTVVFIPFVLGFGFLVYLYMFGRSRPSQGPDAQTTAPHAIIDLLVFLVLLIGVWFAPYVMIGTKAMYRIPIIPLLCVIGAFGIAQTITYMRLRKWRVLACSAAPAAILLPIMLMMPISYEDDVMRWLRLNAEQLEERGNIEAAIAVTKQLAARRPDFAELQNQAAILCLIEGDDVEALLYYLRTLNAIPSWDTERIAHAANQISRIMLRIEEQTGAAPLYQYALDHRNTEYHALIALARSFLWRGAADKASAFLDSARQLGPRDAGFFYVLGTALGAQGHMDRAITAFIEGIRRYPKDPELLIGLADIQRNQGDNEAACRTYRRVLALDPDNEHALSAIAAICGS